MATPAYTQAQLMVAAAAREINNGDVVLVGMRLPLLGSQQAKSTHTLETVGAYKLGMVWETAVPNRGY